MKKNMKALVDYVDARIATIEKNAKSLTDDKAKQAAEESLNQLRELRKQMNDLGEDDPDSIERLRKDVTDALARIDARMNEFASQIEALQERVGSGEEAAANKISAKGAAYLKSDNAKHDFLQAMRESRTSEAFARNWRGKLAENGITIAEGSEDAFLPEAVRGAIQDAWEKPKNWVNRLKNTRAKSYTVRLNTSSQDAEGSRAKGHAKGNQKANEELTFAAKKITPQMIYKKIDVDNMTIFEDDGTLLAYVVEELTNQWLIEVERAILVGDGRQSSDSNKITSIEPIVAAGSTYTTTITRDAGEHLIDQVISMVAAVKNDDGGDVAVFMSLQTLNELRRVMLSDTSTPQYVGKAIVAEQLGVNEIITTSLLGSGYLAIAVRLDKYVTVGSINPAFVEWENYDYNIKNYRVEIPFGGALEAPLSAAVLAAE